MLNQESYEEPAEDSILIKRACQRSNLIIVGPETGVIGGRRATWLPVESPSFMDGVFELTQAVAGDTTTPTSGRMKIGDFVCFCRFLESMTS